VTYVPHGPSAETPDEGGTNGRLRGIQSVYEPSPAARSQPFPARAVSPRAATRSRSPICAARYGRHLTFSGSISVKRLPHAASRHSIAAHVCCRQIAAENSRKPFVRTSSSRSSHDLEWHAGGQHHRGCRVPQGVQPNCGRQPGAVHGYLERPQGVAWVAGLTELGREDVRTQIPARESRAAPIWNRWNRARTDLPMTIESADWFERFPTASPVDRLAVDRDRPPCVRKVRTVVLAVSSGSATNQAAGRAGAGGKMRGICVCSGDSRELTNGFSGIQLLASMQEPACRECRRHPDHRSRAPRRNHPERLTVDRQKIISHRQDHYGRSGLLALGPRQPVKRRLGVKAAMRPRPSAAATAPPLPAAVIHHTGRTAVAKCAGDCSCPGVRPIRPRTSAR
jgi:hypothetical protein